MKRARLWNVVLALAASLAGACASAPRVPPGEPPPHPRASNSEAPLPAPKRMSVDDLLAQPADVKVDLRPPAIVRDRVYGPLLRRASALAAGYAGPRTLGTTALAALERTDEVLAVTNDSGEAVVLLRGVPADLEVLRVVDEDGKPVWRPAVGDVRQSYTEYEPTRGSEASLFVLPGRTWVVAAGVARSRTREVLINALGGVSWAPGEASLASLSIRGAALVRRDARLRTGSLATLGSALVRADFDLTSGAEGVIVTRLVYADAPAATAAEHTAVDVVGAFRRKLEKLDKDRSSKTARTEPPPLSWLAAAGVDRTAATVTVRAPIPRRWLDAIAEADVGGMGNSGATDLPWELWRRRSIAVPALSLPDGTSNADAQEPSQPAGSL
jgi:hypothetical protein